MIAPIERRLYDGIRHGDLAPRPLTVIWLLLGLHLAFAALVAGWIRLERWSLLLCAIPPAATTGWALTKFAAEEPATASLAWVDGLDLELSFRVTDLALLMTLIVSGIGALVFVYAEGYLSPTASGRRRFAAILLGFATAMLGLVWADSVWTLFVFWELTSITSSLLVGHNDTNPAARAAARRALMVTAAGGLALLAGLVVLVDAGSSARLSELGPVDGTSASVAAVLLLVAAAIKSAQIPFHMWLPGAMAAPTPVSAYLHSATMVKAGVLLVALGAPILADAAPWRPLALAMGLGSMVWGAVGALRHVDAKLILAWGTISQLGLMMALLAIGEPKATLAAVALLTAHAVFKAPLFMIVGEIDVRTGTRLITNVHGLRRSMPVAFVAAIVSGASMAGVPPLLGFVAKEAVVEAVIGLPADEAWTIGGLVIAGSVLTVAYTVRLLLGLFGPAPAPSGDGPPPGPTPVTERPRAALWAPAAVLTTLTVAGYALLPVVDEVVGRAALRVDPGVTPYHLHRWPGLSTGLAISVAVVALGGAIGWALARAVIPLPAPTAAEAVDRLLDGIIDAAGWVTGRIQHGSLPVYLATMAATASLATGPFLFGIDVEVLYLWDGPTQGVLALSVVTASAVAAVLQTRLAAALALGAVGIGVSGLFVVQGAPDLALTQLLVETVVVVGFVVGLGHLTRRFPRSGTQWRATRLVVSTAAAIGVAAGLTATASAPSGAPPVEVLVDRAVEVGGGNNVVNVILTDVRALDTLGEILVLAVVAIGIVALAGGRRMAGASASGTETA